MRKGLTASSRSSPNQTTECRPSPLKRALTSQSSIAGLAARRCSRPSKHYLPTWFHEIDDSALRTAKSSLLKVLNAEHTRLSRTAWFKAIVEDRGEIEIEAVNWDVGTDAVSGGTSVRVNIAAENVDDLFEATGRKLN